MQTQVESIRKPPDLSVGRFTNDKAHMTAINRNHSSAPTTWLKEQGLLDARIQKILDYGCGHGIDAYWLSRATDGENVDKYDPYYFPLTKLVEASYDVIICIYVLNVVFEDEQEKIISRITKLLKPGGKAYFAVRRDIKKEGFTTKKTFQRNVVLDLPVLCENSSFCIYALTSPISSTYP